MRTTRIPRARPCSGFLRRGAPVGALAAVLALATCLAPRDAVACCAVLGEREVRRFVGFDPDGESYWILSGGAQITTNGPSAKAQIEQGRLLYNSFMSVDLCLERYPLANPARDPLSFQDLLADVKLPWQLRAAKGSAPLDLPEAEAIIACARRAHPWPRLPDLAPKKLGWKVESRVVDAAPGASPAGAERAPVGSIILTVGAKGRQEIVIEVSEKPYAGAQYRLARAPVRVHVAPDQGEAVLEFRATLHGVRSTHISSFFVPTPLDGGCLSGARSGAACSSRVTFAL